MDKSPKLTILLIIKKALTDDLSEIVQSLLFDQELIDGYAKGNPLNGYKFIHQLETNQNCNKKKLFKSEGRAKYRSDKYPGIHGTRRCRFYLKKMTVDSLVKLHEKGAKAWILGAKSEDDWILTTIASSQVENATCKLRLLEESTGKTFDLEYDLKNLKAKPLPPLANPPAMDYLDDLTNLSYLHEPGVLHTIKMRYKEQNIYTYSGIVLIAVNPFAHVPLYSLEIAQAYSGKRRGELDPHLFAVAEDAFREMVNNNRNQSIIVSGESGAGKTISAKFIMKYFAAVGGSESAFIFDNHNQGNDRAAVSEVEDQVYATNPIMEAFGNAKTTRNDNSSRFGKYIEIHFDDDTSITGATIRTYLLERSRVVFQPEIERNYHIFYQLCAGVPSAEKGQLALSSYDAFHYLKQGGTGTIAGVDDAADFGKTEKALSTVGISVSKQWNIFQLLAAILHIGNIQITASKEDGNSVIADNDTAMKHAARLLGIDIQEFRKWLTHKQISTRMETIVTNMNATMALASRDAVAKYLYHSLFDWLVTQINLSLSNSPNTDSQDQLADGQKQKFIAVLDIYGFEHFKKNSFEQFCINYANEKLQQEFNQHVFKLEQEEYVKEQIEWSFIDFYDNKPCIELIEGKMGILALLDEESRMPSGADSSLITKLYKQFGGPGTDKHNSFDKPRFSNMAFTINHYAHSVDYDIDGFLEKNKDTMPEEILSLLQNSTIEFTKILFAPKSSTASLNDVQAAPTKSLVRKTKPTLGSTFKTSLQRLMETINSTNVHYIRCIKPNEKKLPFTFDSSYVLQQLRACGVLETIRISCAGYPSRFIVSDFADRYSILVHSKMRQKDYRKMTDVILKEIVGDLDKYQIGLTKVFLRAGQLAFLEKLRTDKLNNSATMIQKYIKGRIQRNRFVTTRNLALQLQTIGRAYLARKKFTQMKRERAAITIQRYTRGYLARKQTRSTLNFIIKLQATCRLFLARREYIKERTESRIIRIQSLCRGYLARKKYGSYSKKIVMVQSCARRWLARRQLRKLKVEARSIQHVQQKAGALEKKVFELTQLLAQKEKANSQLKQNVTNLTQQLHAAQESLKKKKDQIQVGEAKLQNELAQVKEKNQDLNNANSSLLEKYERTEKALIQRDSEMQTYKQKITELEQSFDKVIEEKAETQKKESEEKIQQLLAENAALKEKLAKIVRGGGLGRHRGISNVTITTPDSTGPASPISPSHTMENTALDGAAHVTGFKKGILKASPPTSTVNLDHVAPSGATTTLHSPVDRRDKHHRRHSSLDSARILMNKNEEIVMETTISPVDNPADHLPAPELIINSRSSIATSELSKLFHDPVVDREINELLILHLHIPPPLPREVRPKRECLFPAHVIGLCIVHCWRFGFFDRMKTIMNGTIKNIHAVMKYTDNGCCAFWLSNLYELYCIILTAEKGAGLKQQRRQSISDIEFSQCEECVSKFKSDAEFLMIEIYYNWLKELKKKLNSFGPNSVIEHQGLPGFTEPEAPTSVNSVGFISRWIAGSATPAAENSVPLEKTISWLSKLNSTITSFYVPDEIRRQLLVTLIKLLGSAAFNQLLMRKNFCTWRRGMQIQYNVTRIEEWCVQHDVSEASLHMDRLMQAAKLLHLDKANADDLDIIYDVCFLLSPVQIKKLLSIYRGYEYDEHPVTPAVLSLATSRVLDDRDANFMLELNDDSAFEIPLPTNIGRMEKYLPQHVMNKFVAIKHIIEIV